MINAAREKWREIRAMDVPGNYCLGPNTFDRYINDPRRLAFMLSRYKFAAKMLRGCVAILDAGCGDGFGTVALLDTVGCHRVRGVDFDRDLIRHALVNLVPALQASGREANIGFYCSDLMTAEPDLHEGICCLDVIEHIDPAQSHKFIRALADSLAEDGVAVIGTPNALASPYASAHSQVGHINLYDPDRLRRELGAFFSHVFLFSMNDEVVHTGFDKLAHYLIAVCVK
jgi:2-polyprenyl-3-methyl-5-hydroxy-6-metoxy-1,4-benzoquinol methylase